jgi:hypothetical protein
MMTEILKLRGKALKKPNSGAGHADNRHRIHKCNNPVVTGQ